jgi:hypothetical protein
MFLEFLSHYNTIVSHMIKHTGLRFLYGILYVLMKGGTKIFSVKVFWAIFQLCYVFMKNYLLLTIFGKIKLC